MGRFCCCLLIRQCYNEDVISTVREAGYAELRDIYAVFRSVRHVELTQQFVSVLVDQCLPVFVNIDVLDWRLLVSLDAHFCELSLHVSYNSSMTPADHSPSLTSLPTGILTNVSGNWVAWSSCGTTFGNSFPTSFKTARTLFQFFKTSATDSVPSLKIANFSSSVDIWLASCAERSLNCCRFSNSRRFWLIRVWRAELCEDDIEP